MNKDVDNLKVVKIANAIFCVRCNFAYVADVLLTDGKRKKMFYCARRDCDNWVTAPKSELEPDDPIGTWEPTLTTPDDPIVDGWETD